ncbi:hypothetical protein SKAU_G00109660 [Synaphobranchus kaupii]|uniref:Transcription factor HES-5 n=1 Tax=Synaphobranchus kaupii TaxID=118154 RepID=A0A9Q1J8A2_SYNKA|nr:hypothetical protein SKAU_G00109660 [Synaphobranchus kaupii]
MAPCSYSADYSLKMSEKERHKLRKPVVEKMRRDRINSSIEQLKALLETEFRKSDPNAKLEKADVLEMTVSFLQQQLQPRSAAGQKGHSHGYSQCWRETLRYLSFGSKGVAPDPAAAPFQRLPGVRQEAVPRVPGRLQAKPCPSWGKPWCCTASLEALVETL